MSPHVYIPGIRDSKQIPEAERDELYHLITSHPDILYDVHVNSCDRIDEINILEASMEAMAKCIEKIKSYCLKLYKLFKLRRINCDFVLVDGPMLPTIEYINHFFILKFLEMLKWKQL